MVRQIGSGSRKAASKFVEGRKSKVTVAPEDLEEFLARAYFFREVAAEKGE